MDDSGGSGGDNAGTDLYRGMSPRWSNRHVASWLRWRTDKSIQDFDEKDPRELDARELAVAVTLANLTHRDPRVRNGAIRNLIAMEAQNLLDERADDPSVVVHLHAQVEERRSRLSAIRRQLGIGEPPPGPAEEEATNGSKRS